MMILKCAQPIFLDSVSRRAALLFRKCLVSLKTLNSSRPYLRAIFTGTLLFCSLHAADAWAGLTAQDLALFEKANKLYYAEKNLEAQKIYADLFKRYPDHGVLAYNLGNAYYRLGKTGLAILAYERALRRDPRNHDVDRNLKQVQVGLPYRIEDKRNWYLQAAEFSIQKVTESEVALLLAGSYFFFILGFLVPLFFKRWLRFGVVQKVLTVILSVALLVYAAKRVETRVIRDAIIMTKKADVRFGPSEGDRVAFKLGEGLKVSVVDHREGWSRILLPNGDDGWIKNTSIEEV